MIIIFLYCRKQRDWHADAMRIARVPTNGFTALRVSQNGGSRRLMLRSNVSPHVFYSERWHLILYVSSLELWFLTTLAKRTKAIMFSTASFCSSSSGAVKPTVVTLLVSRLSIALWLSSALMCAARQCVMHVCMKV